MPKKTLTLIAAIAVMLVAATSAYGDGYYEGWDGWFNSGSLNYNHKTYEYVEGESDVDDSTTQTTPPVDSFYRSIIPRIAFVCAAGENDSIFVYIDTFWGAKPYGASGEKDGWGFWSGEGYSNRDMKEEHLLFTFGGTWEATFNYDTEPDPTYEGTWMVTWSGWPVSVSGSGTCSGKQTYYIEK